MVDSGYTPALRKLLQRLDPDGDLDSAHDAWIELHRAAQRDQPTIPALVYRTKRRASDKRRRQRLQSADYLRQRIGPRENPGPESLVLEREQCETVRTRVEKLPSRCREVIMLKFFDALSVRHIATRLGIREAAVYKRLERGYRLLASDEALVDFGSPMKSRSPCHE